MTLLELGNKLTQRSPCRRIIHLSLCFSQLCLHFFNCTGQVKVLTWELTIFQFYDKLFFLHRC